MATINTDIAQKIDIVVRENNSSTINLVITEDSGSSFNLTGYNCLFNVYTLDNQDIFSIANNTSSAEGTLTNSLGSTTLSTDGKIIISLNATGTSQIPGAYKYRLVISNNTESRTWMYGKFKINND